MEDLKQKGDQVFGRSKPLPLHFAFKQGTSTFSVSTLKDKNEILFEKLVPWREKVQGVAMKEYLMSLMVFQDILLCKN